jgi:hypothetical protein
MSEVELKLKKRELGILIFRTFAKELIINSSSSYIAKLQTIVEKDKEEHPHEKHKPKIKIKELHEERKRKLQDNLKEQLLRNQILKREQSRQLIEQRRNLTFEKLKLSVPETRLPERFNYLKPTPVEAQVELGNKIDILIQDPNVEAIECPGENEEVIVRGTMGEQKTEIKLSKKEIDDLINTFSELTKIPISEGIYKVVYGKLILLAVVSEVVGSKFLIKKMKKQPPMPNFSPPKAPLPGQAPMNK